MITIKVQIDTRGLKAFRRQIREGLAGTAPGPFMDMRIQWATRFSAFISRRFRDNGVGAGDGSWPPLALSTIRRRLRRHTRVRADVTVINREIKRLRASGSRSSLIGKLERKKRELEGRGASDAGRARSSLARDTQNETGRGRGALVGAQQALGLKVGVAVTILQDTGTLLRALQIGAAGNRLDVVPYGIEYGVDAVPHPPPDGESAKPRTIAQIALYHQNGGTHLPQRKILVPPDQRTAAGMAQDTLRALNKTLEISAREVRS